ncbi:hypothetical protein AB0H71_28440 [Nocardia sp. NPDC050697]|uniref:phthiocerol/phthiodiolone dimycocerosyl transferase family protein n=1 Tax=Nocardia sp. NPDC050697 TaxID=3155158 RepID=UPI0033E04876
MSSRIRSLAPSERLFAMGGAYVGYSVRVRGELDIAALSTAFAALRRRYPVLAASLAADDDGFAIIARSGPLPGVVVSAGEVDGAISIVGADQRRALAALHINHDDDRASVTLLTHHSIADACHSYALLADLWSLYTDAVHGEPLDTTPWGYPKSLETLLAERGIVRAAQPPAAPVAPSRPLDAIRRFAVARARCRLSEDATSALLEFARRHESTLNSVISAAILRVETESRDLPAERIHYSYPVNLRDRLSPPVAAQAATDPLGHANFTPATDVTDIVELAKTITAQLVDDLRTGEIHRAGLDFFDRTMTAAGVGQVPESERRVMVLSSNWGIVPPLRAPERLRFDDFRSMLPEATADTAPNAYFLTTFQGRLSIELRSPFDTATVRQHVAAIEAILSALIDVDVAAP